jgi:hypothetical protein
MPSSIEGRSGEWPDPLVPRVDTYDHEPRNAFPFKLVKRRNQSIWFDVYVPPLNPQDLTGETFRFSFQESKRSVFHWN